MSFAWSAEITGSNDVARGIAVLQRHAAYDATVWARAITAVRNITEKNQPIGEWNLIDQVTAAAQVNESIASSAVCKLCDDGVLDQNADTSELSLAH